LPCLALPCLALHQPFTEFVPVTNSPKKKKGILKSNSLFIADTTGDVRDVNSSDARFRSRVDRIHGSTLTSKHNCLDNDGREEDMRMERDKCQCRWEGTWVSKCPLHGSDARSRAEQRWREKQNPARAKSNVFDRYEEGGELYQKTTKSPTNFGVVEKQDHSGVGKATYGVRKNEGGWWVDKSEEVFHKNEMKVKFHDNLVVDYDVNANDEAQNRFTTLRQKKMEESLQFAKQKFEQSSESVGLLQEELADATAKIHEMKIEQQRTPMTVQQERNLERRKRQIEKEAKNLTANRVPKADEKQRFLNGSQHHGETEFPSHLRMSYEGDVDMMRFRNRMDRIKAREDLGRLNGIGA